MGGVMVVVIAAGQSNGECVWACVAGVVTKVIE